MSKFNKNQSAIYRFGLLPDLKVRIKETPIQLEDDSFIYEIEFNGTTLSKVKEQYLFEVLT